MNCAAFSTLPTNSPDLLNNIMEHDQQTVHYVTQDAMPNLKLRVSLTLLSAARSRPAREVTNSVVTLQQHKPRS